MRGCGTARRSAWPRPPTQTPAGLCRRRDPVGPGAVCSRQPLRVVDLGAGTGKLTAALVRLGAEAAAVEPDQQMLAELRREMPGVIAVPGHAEDIPLPDGSVDAILAARRCTGSTWAAPYPSPVSPPRAVCWRGCGTSTMTGSAWCGTGRDQQSANPASRCSAGVRVRRTPVEERRIAGLFGEFHAAQDASSRTGSRGPPLPSWRPSPPTPISWSTTRPIEPRFWPRSATSFAPGRRMSGRDSSCRWSRSCCGPSGIG